MDRTPIRRQRDIPALTGLRGAAAIWVVAFHMTDQAAAFRFGYLGVDVFFLLSGYILSFVYGQPSDVRSARSYMNFLLVRLVRIYPVYLVVLLVLGIFVVLTPQFADGFRIPEQRWSLGSYVASLLLVQNWMYFLPTCWNTPAWSLSAEWFAYLAFPIFQTLTRWPRTPFGCILLSGCILALYPVVMLSKHVVDPDLAGTPGMVRMACEFAAGCLLFSAVRNGLPQLNAWADLAVCGFLGVAVSVGGAMTWLALPAFGLIVLLAARERGPIAVALGLPVVVWLGEISYSVYITHWVVLQFGRWSLAGPHQPKILANGFVQAVVLSALCLVTAVCTHRWIELPSRARGREWARRLASGPNSSKIGLSP